METALALFNTSNGNNGDHNMAIIVNSANNQQEVEYFQMTMSKIAKETLRNKFKVGRYYTEFKEIKEHSQTRYKKATNTVVFCRNMFSRQEVVLKAKHVEENSKDKLDDFEHNKFEIYFCEKLCNKGHPNIVMTYNYWIEESSLSVFIEMERCQKSLHSYMIERDFKLDIKTAVGILRQIVDALFFCHSNRVIHGDVKEHNILLTTDPESGDITVKLTDFEVSRETDALGNIPYISNINTSCYLPFEVLMGREFVTVAVDMFAVGCVFITMISGDALRIRDTDRQKQLDTLNAHSGPISDRLWSSCTNLFNLTRPLAANVKTVPSVYPEITQHGPLVVSFVSKLLDNDYNTRMTSFSAKHDPLFFQYQ